MSCSKPKNPKGPSIKYVTLFLANFHPLPLVTLCHTSRDPPQYVTHLGPPPRFLLGLVQKTLTKGPFTNSLSIVRRDFCLASDIRNSLSYKIFSRYKTFIICHSKQQQKSH